MVGLCFPGCTPKKDALKLRADIIRSLTGPDAAGLVVTASDVDVTLKEADSHGRIKGGYRVVRGPDAVEQGEVCLDCNAVALMGPLRSDRSTDGFYFAAPFYVTNQGSGVFHYAGLFSYDAKTRQSKHLDSYWLGDRLQAVEIHDYGMVCAIKVSFLRHALQQSYSAYPSEAASVNLYVQDDQTWRLYKGMHPSWDQNNDGINDCEDDGTCDDSVDYSAPRDA